MSGTVCFGTLPLNAEWRADEARARMRAESPVRSRCTHAGGDHAASTDGSSGDREKRSPEIRFGGQASRPCKWMGCGGEGKGGVRVLGGPWGALAQDSHP